jgi:lipopolysaccharide transport system ATP-binding protein
MTPKIEIKNIGKQYILDHRGVYSSYETLRDTFSSAVRNVFKRQETKEVFWALKDINLTITQGQVIGIIGRNGAGKSTLLKIISNIIKPTTGEIRIRGRVTSLLEVGTGFHTELSGRENIYLNGAILGMSKAEIDECFDEIVAFAEVEKFLDTPIKHFSSGMYMRLAFSVAAHLRSDILIVDETLSVGDVNFQKKSLEKMQEFAQNKNKIVLFVSHDMNTVSTLTNTCIFLKEGKISYVGDTNTAITKYLEDTGSKKGSYAAQERPMDRPHISSVRVQTSEPNNFHIHGKPLKVTIRVFTPRSLKDASLSFQIINQQGQPYIHLWTYDTVRHMCREPGEYELECEMPVSRLYMGNYRVSVWFTGPPGLGIYEHLQGVCPFEVTMYGHERDYPWHPNTCAYIEDCTWNITKK